MTRGEGGGGRDTTTDTITSDQQGRNLNKQKILFNRPFSAIQSVEGVSKWGEGGGAFQVPLTGCLEDSKSKKYRTNLRLFRLELKSIRPMTYNT